MASSFRDVPLTLEQLARQVAETFDECGDAADDLPRALFLAHPWLVESAALTEAFLSLYRASEDPTVRRRVLYAVSFWIERHPVHFDAAPELCAKVGCLRDMASTSKDDEDVAERLDVSALPSYAWMRSLSVRHPVSKQVSLSFDQWSPEDISNSLSHIDFKALSRITIEELKCYVRNGRLRECMKLERSITVFNNLTNWVQCMILSKATPKERAEIVTKFVNVGKHLRKHNNFNTLMAVIGGVTHSNIARLGKTHAQLTPEIKKDLSLLSTLLSMQSNYASYRKALEECKSKFRIPIMGVHLKDLIAASIGNDFEKTRKITKRKLQCLSNTLSHFMVFATSTNNLPEPHTDLVNTLKVSLDIRYNDDDIYQMSLRREPRTLLTFEPSSKCIVFADWANGVSAVPDPETVEKHILAMVDAVFKHYDHDKDGYISQSEFRQISGNFPFIDPFGTIDVDRDGQISKNEMKDYFMRMNKTTDLRREFKHNFSESSFLAPISCSHCTKIMWGILRAGYRCGDCGLAVHENCRDSVVVECRRKSSDKGTGGLGAGIERRESNEAKEKTSPSTAGGGGFGDWFSMRNSTYNSSFRRLLGSVRGSRFRTSSTVSASPEPPNNDCGSPTQECSQSAREATSFRLRLPRGGTGIPTRTASESAACCYKGNNHNSTDSPPLSAQLASLACEEVFEDEAATTTALDGAAS